MGNTCCKQPPSLQQQDQPQSNQYQQQHSNPNARNLSQYKNYPKFKQKSVQLISNRQQRILKDQILLQQAKNKLRQIKANELLNIKNKQFQMRKVQREIEYIEGKIERMKKEIQEWMKV